MKKRCPECDRKYGGDVDYCAHDGAQLQEIERDEEDPLLGRMLDGRWQIREKIGEGGMGTIYLASQKSVEREVVVKTLRSALSDNEEFSDRFMQEARVTSTINHPHCVTIFDFGQAENNTLYLAMEYLDGEPLADRLERDRVEIRRALEVARQVASALSAAHDHEVVHRDLKPENVFLLDISDGSTFVKVLDFGISKDLKADEDLTQTGQLFGTPRYMSPEQCRGDELDGRSDLYSLGCILYEMLAGRTPFVGEKSMEILVSHVQDEIPGVDDVAERRLPPGIVELVTDLLEKEPEDRPATAGAVRQRLDTLLSDWVASEEGASSSENAAGGGGRDGTRPGVRPEPGEDGERGSHAGEFAGEPSGPLEQAAGPEVGVGDELKSSSRAERAGEISEEGVEAGGTGWLRRHRGLVWTLAGLAAATGLLVFGGVGYLFYVQTSSNGEDSFADRFHDLGTSGRNRAPGEDAGPSAQRAAAESEAGGREGRALAEGGAGGGGRETESGEGGPAESRGKGRHREQRGDTTSAERESARDRGSESGATESDGPRPNASGASDTVSSESEPERPGSSTGAAERKSDGAEGSSSPGVEPPSKMPGPERYVERSSLSTTGSACNEGDVRRKLDAVAGALGRCFHDESGGGPTSAGSVMMDWNISTDGEALDVSVLTSEVAGSALPACVVEQVEGIEFAPPSGGRCYTRVSFEFGPPSK